MIGQKHANYRQVFVRSDSRGAVARPDDPTPPGIKFTYGLDQKSVKAAHDAIQRNLSRSLTKVYAGTYQN